MHLILVRFPRPTCELENLTNLIPLYNVLAGGGGEGHAAGELNCETV